MAAKRDSRLNRFLARLLAAALIATAPGVRPYQALAQNIRVVNTAGKTGNVASGTMGVTGVSPIMLGGFAQNLSGTGKASIIPLQAAPGVMLTPSAENAGVLAAALPKGSAAGINTKTVSDGSVKTSIQGANPALPGLEKSRAPPVEAETSRISKKTAVGRLSKVVSGIPRLLGLSGSALKAEAGHDFEGAARSGGGVVSAEMAGGQYVAPGEISQLKPSGFADLDSGSHETAVDEAPDATQEAPAPKQKISRALRIGALTAIIMLALDVAVMAAAAHFGYQFHPSYAMPELSDPAAFSMFGDFLAPILAKAQEFFSAAWVAPLNEEVYFRAGVIGFAGFSALKTVGWVVRGLEKIKPQFSKLRSWIAPAAFGLVATEAAMFFALLHEMSDPILITVRIAQALLMSYLYMREGLVSGIAHHAVFNGLAVLSMPLIYAGAGLGMTVLAGNSFLVAAVLGGAAYLLWKFTRKAAKTEASEMRAGRLAAYRLSAKASTWLGRAGWATVAILVGIAALQPTSAVMLLTGSMAAQLAPAAFALGAYGFLLKNLKKREGAAAVSKIRNPEGPFAFGNRVGAWVGGTFGAMYLGIIGGLYMLKAGLMIPGIAALSLPMGGLVTAALPLLVLAGLTAYRLKAGREGISPWLYVSQFFFGTVAAVTAAIPMLIPLLERFAETAASSGLNAGMILPTLMSTLWTIPVFIVLAIVMTLIARAIFKSHARTQDVPAKKQQI